MLVNSADVHARRHFVDPNSSLWCLRFGPHFLLKTPGSLGLSWTFQDLGFLGWRVAPLSSQYAYP